MVDPNLPPDVGTGVGGKVVRKSKTRRPTNSEFKCRFCFMKFEKSQALGGHMNLHRHERDQERYQHAQQLVSSMAQQRMPPTWTSHPATEMAQSPLVPSGARGARDALSGLSSQSTVGPIGQRFPGPSFSYASYQGPTPTSIYDQSVPSPQSSNSFSYDNLQSLHWSMNGGFSTATTPRSALQYSGSSQAVETTSTSLPFPPELLVRTLQSSTTNNDSSLIHSGTLTSTAQGPDDFKPSFPSSFSGGM